MRQTIAIGIIVAACIIASAPSTYATEDGAVPDALTVIHNRKSVRNFNGQDIAKGELDTILRAGMAAPTAVNMQPWAFVVVTDRATMNALAAQLPYAKMLDRAGAAIIVCALPEEAFQRSKEFAILDTACASENILLAAEALGLGAVWTAAYPDEERMAAVRKTLGIPDAVIPLNVIPIGHPTGVDKPKNKFKPAKIHWERWGR